MKIHFPATVTQLAFIQSLAYLNFLRGPRGEGKTTTGVFATLYHALDHEAVHWPVRWAVVRDTWENLKRTTLDSMRKCVQKYGLVAEGLDKLEPKVVKLGLRTADGAFRSMVEYHFFGLDAPQDANALQGFEGGGAWIEEPAPAADLASGVPEASLLAVTSLRQDGIRPRVQVTMNPSDEGHWTIKYQTDQEVIEEMRKKGVTIAWFDIPPGENPGITPEYRARNRAILEAMGRFDLIARLVEGRIGYIQLGEAVTPEFSELHMPKQPLPILSRLPIIRGWDFGLNPTTAWFQILPPPVGRIYIFNSIRTEHQGCEQHILESVIPWQTRRGIMKHRYEDIGDPNGLTPEARNSNLSAVSAIESLLTRSPGEPAIYEPGPISIPDRVDPLRYLLRRMTKHGVPVVQVDPEAIAMRRALGGGWHRKKLPAGIIGEIVKDEHSEHGDALGYPLGTKFPMPRLLERKARRDRHRTAAEPPPSRQAWMAG